MLCSITSCYVTCYVMLYNILFLCSCYVVLCCICYITCNVMLRYITYYVWFLLRYIKCYVI